MPMLEKPLFCKARRDLVWAVLFFVLITALAYVFDLNEAYEGWAGQYEAYQLDEIPPTLAVMAMVFGWFSWRRWRDVLVRKQAEADHREHQDRLTDLLEAASDRFWETDDQYRIAWLSSPGQSTAPSTEYLGRTCWESSDADPKTDSLWAAHITDLEARRPFRNFRFSKLRNGRLVHRSMSGKPFFDSQGKFLGYRGTSTDITTEVEAQIEAAEVQTRFLSAIESIADGFALWDSEDRLVICNDKYLRGAEKMGIPLKPGMTFEEFIRGIAKSGGPVDAVGHEEEWVKEQIANHKTGTKPVHVAHGERWVEVNEHHLPNGSTLTMTRDITDQKEMEKQLRQAQKMKAVGQLTGGIAHDFNNLLQVILGNIEMIIEQVPRDSKLAAQATVAKAASERGADLIRRLMAFSRQQSLQPKAFDLNHMVAEMSEIAHRTLGEDIVIRTQLAADLDPVYLDHVQAEAAFLNLAINARDAMPDGGTLFIETSEVIREKNETSDQLELFPGRYILLSITDTGTGMSPDVLAHAVEPFFTTKDVGKGTGLGLSMTYGFIKQSGGDVKIYSEPGTGTAVKLFLPTAQGRNVSGSKTESSEPDLTGNETILLVEDEEHVRNYAIMQIEQLGYHVISASDGASALQKIKQLDGQVDLLFTDVTMPGGMNGRQLAQNIAGLYPNLKVLYTSGYNQNAIIHAGKLEPGVALLEKPYHKIDLARKLRELLDDDSRSRV